MKLIELKYFSCGAVYCVEQNMICTDTQCGSPDYLAILQQALSFKLFNISFY